VSDSISRMEGKIDKIQEDIAEIKSTLAVNTESLKVHVKRTDLLEARIDSFWPRTLTVLSIIAILGKFFLGL
jgi:hypothetical protein